MAKARGSSLVYSTESGRVCPKCGRPVADCVCKQQAAAPLNRGPLRVRLDTKGRRGKAVTVVSGVPLAPADLEAFGKELRRRCGAGGTVKDGTIESQGDHRAAVAEGLRGRGWKVKE